MTSKGAKIVTRAERARPTTGVRVESTTNTANADMSKGVRIESKKR